MKKIFLYIWGICTLWAFALGFFPFQGVSAVNDYCNQGDLMQQAFCRANQKEVIVDMGNTKYAVGNEVIKGTTEISIDGKLNVEVNQKGSLFIRITRFLLMMTVVLSITMIIVNGIQYILKTGTGEDPKDVVKNIVFIGVGIILALSSVLIINLLRSVGETTLKEIDSYQTSTGDQSL